MIDPHFIEALAREFARLIRDQLSPGQLEGVIKINRSNQSGSCATLKFCRAYELMATAFTAVIRRPPVPNSPVDLALAGAAWAIARNTEFARTIEFVECNAIGESAYAYSIRDLVIEDPTLSECARFDANPLTDYGLRPQEVVALERANALLKAYRAATALSAARDL